MIVLLGLPRIIPGISKELVMVDVGLIIILFLIYALSYTKIFSNGSLFMENLCMLLPPLLLVVVVVGGLLVLDVGVIVFSLIIVLQFTLAFL